MKKALSIFIIFAFSFSLVRVCFASGYSYQRQISVCQNSKCPSSQTSFTVLVCFNGASPCNTSVAGLNQTGGGAHVQNSNGYDIVFSTTACASPTLMNWETETYVASTGELEAWVLVTSLSSGGNTIYMCYGNASISTFQGGATGTAWDSNYKMVWHLPNGTTLNASDSTTNGNTGTIGGATAVTGIIDGGAAVNGSSQISVASNAGLEVGTGDFTISVWEKTSASLSFGALFDKGTSGHGDYSLFMNAGKLAYEFVGGQAGGAIAGTATINNGAWHLISWTRSGNSNLFYVDGTQDTSTLDASNSSTAGAVSLGKNPSGGGVNWNGSYDEFHIANTTRSADWIKTEYNNQNSPSTFETVGSETALGGGAINLFFFMWI
jgi:hypothetical protein